MNKEKRLEKKTPTSTNKEKRLEKKNLHSKLVFCYNSV